MIDLQSIDSPVCLSESTRIIANKVVAGSCLLTAGTSVPDVLAASPVTTESGVDDDLLLRKHLVDVASPGELGSRLAPSARIGSIAEYICWLRPTGEEIDVDGV